MKKRNVLVVFLLSTFCVFACCVLAAKGRMSQDNSKPFTKQEIIRRLKPTPGVRYEQGDLAAEIEQRGIAFPVDAQTLDELRRAGAHAFLIQSIRNAAQAAAAKRNPPPPQTGAAPQSQNADSGDHPHLLHDPPPDPSATQSGAQPGDKPGAAEENQPEEPKIDVSKLPLIEQARYHANEFMNDLPNFVVTQIVTRYARTAGKRDFEQQDKLEIELSYRSKTGEQFHLVRYNDKPTTMSYDQLKGATSTGEFGSILGAVFAPQSQAEFKEARRETFHKRQTVVYDFRVKKAFSLNQITDVNSGRSVVAGYSGSVWIDKETGCVLRIEQSADDIQLGFPVSLAENAVEYDWLDIDGQRRLLPINAEIILGNDAEHFYSKNVIEMRNYHMFDTDLKILPEK